MNGDNDITATADVLSDSAGFRTERRGDRLLLHLSGRLDARGTGAVWNRALAALAVGAGRVAVDATRVVYCDGIGLALLQQLRSSARERGLSLEIEGLDERFARLLDRFAEMDLPLPEPERQRPSAVARIGLIAAALWGEARDYVAFIGRVAAALIGTMAGRHQVRWRETFRIAQNMGADALPLIAMLAFLTGAVISLKVARSLMEFGDMMEMVTFNATAMTSTLAPLLTTIVVVGRSTAAFAAELATMRVNEELDALVVMGIDAVPYLALGRVLAGIVSVPLLAVFFELFGIIGGLAVWLSFGYSPELYLQQLRTTILLRTVFGALAKTVTFGAIAAILGCFYGLRQGASSGARAVAEAATRAVVAGMVVIAITDAAFAVLYYFLKV